MTINDTEYVVNNPRTKFLGATGFHSIVKALYIFRALDRKIVET